MSIERKFITDTDNYLILIEWFEENNRSFTTNVFLNWFELVTNMTDEEFIYFKLKFNEVIHCF